MLPAPAPSARPTSLVRRALVTALGGAIGTTGLVMMVLPGPGLLMIFMSLAVLATEYEWARRTLDRGRGRAEVTVTQLRDRRAARLGVIASSSLLMVAGAVTASVSDPLRYLGLGSMAAGALALAVLVPAIQRLVVRTPAELTPR